MARSLYSLLAEARGGARVTAAIVSLPHRKDCECDACGERWLADMLTAEAAPVFVMLPPPRPPPEEYAVWYERTQRWIRLLRKRQEWTERDDPWLQIIRRYPGSEPAIDWDSV